MKHDISSFRTSGPEKRNKWIRYISAWLMICAMTGVAEWTDEKEIIFPEMAALIIGMWIVNKRVWKISRFYMVMLMTAGAVAGIHLVRYSPFPLLVNLSLSFLFAAICLTITRTTLIPLISACMLPVLLKTESWIYPLAVFVMSLIVVCGQWGMEKKQLRQPIPYAPSNRNSRKEIWKWFLLLSTFLIIAVIPVYTTAYYCILPPLVVTYVEFASSKAGFRNRPVQIFLLLVIAAILGSSFQLLFYHWMGCSEMVVACADFICLFALYEWSGKYFAPAGAVTLIPMIIPQADLFWFPVQIAVGAALFISVAMLVFLKCYKWPKAHLMVSVLPAFMRRRRPHKSLQR